MWLAHTALAASGAEPPGNEGGDSDLLRVLFLLGAVGVMYLVTHTIAAWFQRTFLFRTGFEYVVLGIVLGPAVVETIHPFGDLTALGPVFAFTAGWIGLLYGLELRGDGTRSG